MDEIPHLLLQRQPIVRTRIPDSHFVELRSRHHLVASQTRTLSVIKPCLV
jgi:hypothetical protein